jgi:serine protease Do
MKRLLPLLAAALLLQACGSMRTFPEVEAREPVPAQQATRPLMLSKVVVDFDTSSAIAREMTGAQCGNTRAVKWSKELVPKLRHSVAEHFNAEFRAAHYRIVGRSDDLFDDGGAAKAEFEAGAIVEFLSTDYCYPWAGVGVHGDIKGTAYARIRWQFYDVLEQKTVYKVVTEGRYEITHTEKKGWGMFLEHALEQSVRNLLADPQLATILSSEPQLGAPVAPMIQASTAPIASASPPAPADAAPIAITAAPPTTGLEAPRAATVIVYVAGAFGSGVIINPDGYILTNYHVVEGAERVRVKLADNRQLLAQVLRRDARRDVALLKLEGSGYPAAALRLPPDLQIGDEVFAIGSPLGEQNSLTVTRGIVSAFRKNGGYPLIQSDVSVQHGNSGGPLVDRNGKVIALCVSGATSAVDRSEGINYFIPIDEAVNYLHIQIQ